MTLHFKGELEIDTNRGVIYFHSEEYGRTMLRICRLPKIPADTTFIDLTHMWGVSFTLENGSVRVSNEKKA